MSLSYDHAWSAAAVNCRDRCTGWEAAMRHAQRFLAILIVVAILLAVSFAPYSALGQASGTQTIIVLQVGKPSMTVNGVSKSIDVQGTVPVLSLIHISEPTRLGMISY